LSWSVGSACLRSSRDRCWAQSFGASIVQDFTKKIVLITSRCSINVAQSMNLGLLYPRIFLFDGSIRD
jgi:hypothetical protein